MKDMAFSSDDDFSDSEMDMMDDVPEQPLLDEGDICGDGSILKEILKPGNG